MAEKDNNAPVYKKWWFWVCLVIIVPIVASVIWLNTAKNIVVDTAKEIVNTTNSSSSNEIAVGTDFSFDGLTLNVSPNYTFDVISNVYSENNGKTVVVLPITVKNTSDKAASLNMYSYKIYGTEGVELDKPSSYFMDNSSDFAGNLQPGASYTKNLYFLYDGNGTYKIEFGYFKTEVSVALAITK